MYRCRIFWPVAWSTEARKALDIESLRLLRSDEIYEPEFHEILGKRMAEAEEQHYQRIPVKLDGLPAQAPERGGAGDGE